MNQIKSVSAGYFDGVWKLFASLKLTIALLLSLAATSIVGTLIPQNQELKEYFQAFGPFLFQIFDVLDIFDMYHAWWFQLLLLMLVLNITVCSIDRLSVTWKIIFPKVPKFKASRFINNPNMKELNIHRQPDDLKSKYESVLNRFYSYTSFDRTDDGIMLFAEKGRWTRLGVYAVHLSIILLLVGGLIGSNYGFEGFVNIPEGESADQIRLRNSGKIIPLGFTIRCDDFNITHYRNGAVREWRSSLSILEDGKLVFQKDIIVNDPLRYKGINIFQSSLGELGPETSGAADVHPIKPGDDIILDITSTESGMSYRKTTIIGREVAIPEGLGTFVVTEYRPDAQFRGQVVGEAIVGIHKMDGADPVEILLPLHFPAFDKMRKGQAVFSVAEQTIEKFSPGSTPEMRYYTGLQVTNDPGVWVVYSGFMMIIAGCIITFFMSHQKMCVHIIPKEGGSIVRISGTANKNKPGMWKKVDRIADEISQLT